MADELSVDEAAGALGVSNQRVRKLLSDGLLPGRHVGRAWLVPAAAVAQLASRQHGAGRPLSPPRAWALLDILDAGRAPWLGKVARSQVRQILQRLKDADPLAWQAALRGREERKAISGHRSAISRLSDSDGVWPAGPAIARSIGADLVVVEAVPELYVPPERWDRLESKLRLRPAEGRPDVYIRVPRGPWPFGSAGPGRAALAASLLDGGDWRSARAGAGVLNELAEKAIP